MMKNANMKLAIRHEFEPFPLEDSRLLGIMISGYVDLYIVTDVS